MDYSPFINDVDRLVFNSQKGFLAMRSLNTKYTDYISRIKLDEFRSKVWFANPHSRSIIVNEGSPILYERKITEMDMHIDFDEDTSEYEYHHSHPYYSCSHLGQLKLVLMEIYFLTRYSSPGDTILYIGAACGSHIPILSEKMFPYLNYELYDPAEFTIQESSNVHIHNSIFDMNSIKDIKYNNILFISDIRSKGNVDIRHPTDQYVMADNELQKDILIAINPKAASLKFRIPFDQGRDFKYDCVDGDYVYQPFVGPMSSEVRIFWDRSRSTSKEILCSRYEDIMFKHNRLIRQCLFYNDISDMYWLDNCFDCSAYDYIIEQFVIKHYPGCDIIATKRDIIKYINNYLYKPRPY